MENKIFVQEFEQDLCETLVDLFETLVWLKAWFNYIEEHSGNREKCQKYHAPVHAKIDAALAKAVNLKKFVKD